MPWVPPYFGSYEQLVNELLHDPFLGSGRPRPHATTLLSSHAEPHPDPWSVAAGPQPQPWRTSPVAYLATLVSLEELSHSVKDQAVAHQLSTTANRAISAFIDDFCGTPPGRIPWPWPGPPPWAVTLASELVALANTAHAGSYREGLMRVAGRIAERSLGGQASAAAAG
jgi:hypothetical protein